MAHVNLGNEMVSRNLDPTAPAFIALHIFQAKKNPDGIVQAAMLIANHLFNESKYEHALNYLLLADKQFSPMDKSKKKAYVLNKIGFVHFHLKHYAESLNMFSACAVLFESLGDTNEVAKTYCSLGLIYQDLGEPDKANDLFQKAVDTARIGGNEVDALKYESLIL
ncbi:MAG: tetratricopeptide repeat protein [Candidatus Lokiarchaeota archaeon]|nr:tetratricopeptide repeat protein [Candidatus Lokiarchaeota archaeon]